MPTSRKKKRVLIVDDFPDNIRVMINILSARYSIIVSTGGSEAIEIVQSDNRPDLILLDVMMPGVDGFKVCRELKADKRTRDIPIIFITALTDEINMIKGFELGAVDYVTKPFNPKIVLARIQTHLELSAYQTDLEKIVDERTSALETAARHMRKERDRAEQYLDIAGVMFVALNTQGEVTLINKKGLSVLEYDEDEVLGKNWVDDFIPKEIRKDIKSIFFKIMSGDLKSVEFYESPILTKSGKQKLIAWKNACLRDENGEIVGTLGSGENISEQREFEDALKLTERKLRILADNIDDVLWINKPGNAEQSYISPAFEKIWGIPAEDITDLFKSFFKAVHQDDREDIFKELNRSHYKGSAYQVEYRIKRPDGSVRWIYDRGFPVYDDQGNVEMMAGIASDITNRKNLEDQLHHAIKMETIGRLAGGVAHDFNNALTPITGISEMLLLKSGLDNKMQDSVREIKEAGERCANLTRQLLAFGRRQHMEMTTFDLNDVVRDVEKLLSRIIGEDIVLNKLLDSEPVYIKADVGQIEQIIVNLAVNARDAMPFGGSLTIETKSVYLDDVFSKKHVSVTPGHYIMMAVSDTGEGMDEDIQTKIFEPFFTTKEEGKGTGLGLATVYGIVRQSGGNIFVNSELNIGTTIIVYLPMVEAVPIRGESQQKLTMADVKGFETILLVEDDDSARKTVNSILSENGYHIIDACGGEDALKSCERHDGPIHLLLTDVIMPGMTGKELAGHISRVLPETKIIFMSGYTGSAIVHHGVLEKGIQFVQKPFTMDSLLTKVRQVLDS